MNALDELEEIKELVNNDKYFKYKNIVNFNCESIEKSLKALKIIKEKVMPLVSISDGCVWDGVRYHGIEISEEDSILLKEVLSNECN